MDEIRAAFGSVEHLELRVNLVAWISSDLLGHINVKILPAFVAGVLREICFVFEGHYSTLQHFLQDPACTTVGDSLQQNLLDLSPEVVIFASNVVIERPCQGPMSVEVMFKETFADLCKHGIAKVVPPEGASPANTIVALA